MKTIKALVVFPVEVEVVVEDNADEDTIVDALGDEADRIIGQTEIAPMVQESLTNPELEGLSLGRRT